MGHRGPILKGRAAELPAWGARFFLAAALTATQIPGGYAPFALGCVAACGPGPAGIAALLGAGAGALLFLDFSSALPFLAARGPDLHPPPRPFRASSSWRARCSTPWPERGSFWRSAGSMCSSPCPPCGIWPPAWRALCWWGSPPGTTSRCSGADRSGRIRTGYCSWRGPWPWLWEMWSWRVSLWGGPCCACCCCAPPFSGAPWPVAAAGLGGGLAADLCAGAGGVLFGGAYGLAGLLAGCRNGRRGWTALAFLAGIGLTALPAGTPVPLLPEAAAGAPLPAAAGPAFGGKRVKREDAPALSRRTGGAAGPLDRTAAACGTCTTAWAVGAPSPPKKTRR